MNKNWKFEAGKIIETAAVREKRLSDERFAGFLSGAFADHMHGRWRREGRASNEEALKNGDRIVSTYARRERKDGVWNELYRIVIVTEPDRSATTVMFPDEY